MTWQQLLAERKVQRHTTSRQELDDLRAVVERDLADAGLSALSPLGSIEPFRDRSFISGKASKEATNNAATATATDY
jgi:hypothetical protein